MTRSKGVILALSIAMTLATAAAALAEPPPYIAAKLRAIGRVVDVRQTSTLYAPLQRRPPYDGARFVRDLKYGDDPKQAYDIATPAQTSKRLRPVLLFVHDGGYAGGDKTQTTGGQMGPFYDNIMLWAVGKDMVGVNMNYRLAPAAVYPAAQEDIGALIKLLKQTIRRYGGDPNRIYIWGHSAGASHVASYVADPRFHPDGKVGVRGAIISSGSYDRVLGDIAQRPHNYYGQPADLAARSSVGGLVKTAVPLFVAAAELDQPATLDQTINLNTVMCAAGHCPAWYGVLKGHSHISEVEHVNTADEALTGPLLEFIRTH